MNLLVLFTGSVLSTLHESPPINCGREEPKGLTFETCHDAIDAPQSQGKWPHAMYRVSGSPKVDLIEVARTGFFQEISNYSLNY